MQVPGLLRRAVARLTEGDDAVAARELQGEVAASGATAVAQCCKGEPVTVAGTLRAVTLRPSEASRTDTSAWASVPSVTAWT